MNTIQETCFIPPTSLQTIILLIDKSVLSYHTFVTNVNTNTYPIIYSNNSDSSLLLNFIKSNFKVITRIGIVFYGSTNISLFLNNMLFNSNDNINFLVNLINIYQVKNIDYLACNTLNYSEWTDYYTKIKTNTDIIIGASSDKTGNIKYGGDWLMESTCQDIELIYFTSSIENYVGLLDSPQVLGSGFNSPVGIAVDNLGNVYVADNIYFEDAGAIKKIVAVNGIVNSSSDVTTIIKDNSLSYLNFITIDSSGNIFVTGDFGVKKIVATNGFVDSSSNVITIAWGSFIYPRGIAIDNSGNVFVSDNDNSIKKTLAVNGVVDSSSSIITIANSFNFPMGIAIDNSGNIFIADTRNNMIKKIVAVNGIVSSSPSIIDICFIYNPYSIAIDSSGNIYVSCGNLINKLLAINGVVSSSPSIIGIGRNLNNIYNIDVDKNQYLIVVDMLI